MRHSGLELAACHLVKVSVAHFCTEKRVCITDHPPALKVGKEGDTDTVTPVDINVGLHEH